MPFRPLSRGIRNTALLVFVCSLCFFLYQAAFPEKQAELCPEQNITDAAWWAGKWGPQELYDGFERVASYITVRDGTRIATYRYLPKGLAPGERIPAILISTPYITEVDYTWIGDLFNKGPSGTQALAESFARYGYATIFMDVRGAGASFGVKKSIFIRDVVRDGSDVVDWIVAQSWSNGNVGATGVSAEGMTANWLMIANNPAVKAVAPRFTTFDIFYDVHPGGVLMNRFVMDIDRQIRLMDSNQLWRIPESAYKRSLSRMMMNGIQPMDADRDGSLLEAAVSEHAANEYFASDIAAVTFRDERLPGSSTNATLDTQSPFNHVAAIEASGAAIYLFAGWFDGAFSRAMINYYQNVNNPGKKIVIGPWPHGGRNYSSPHVCGYSKTYFSQIKEIVRFFDFHLKGIDNGIGDEPPIHYFTMGSEEWKSAQTWPPAGQKLQRLYLGPGHTLVNGGSPPGEEHDIYQVDFSATTGVHSRYGKHLTGGRERAKYPDRRERDEKLLVYNSAPLPTDLEITGHPSITLHVSSDATDGIFIVYLEDVDPEGRVYNVSDGVLRGTFRKTSSAEPSYQQPMPYRTFNKADSMPIVPGEVMQLTFDLFPISYRFEKGHSIRVALTGADHENFPLLPANAPPTWHVYRGGNARASYIEFLSSGTSDE
jgi:putative CocE/NonD family hydrolase